MGEGGSRLVFQAEKRAHRSLQGLRDSRVWWVATAMK